MSNGDRFTIEVRLGGVTDFSVKKVGYLYTVRRIVKVFFVVAFLNVFVFLKACIHSIMLMHFGQDPLGT